nr:helix-turn-helix domain-containing protein [Streptomyces sp. IMTB 2501]
MAEPVRARRLTDEEGRTLQRIARRGRRSTIKVRRALIIMASASGNTNKEIAALVAADPDTVRDVIHAFDERGPGCLDPKWAGGRPRRITADDEAYIVQVASTRPRALDRPFTHWSLRKLADHLSHPPAGIRRVTIGRERLRALLHRHHISLQRTRTWKETRDPDADAKPDRTERVTRRFADRCFRLRPVRTAVHPALPRHLLGPGPSTPTGCPPPTTAPTASATFTAVTASATTAWNVVGIVVLAIAAISAKSVALAGFGLDSLIGIGASTVVVWELSGTGEERQRRALKLIGVGFAALAVYVLVQSTWVLATGYHPHHSPLGIGWTAITAAVMFALAAGKARTGAALDNPVLKTEGRVTLIDTLLAAAVLLGLVLNATVGWWWADPAAGYVLVYYALREVREIFSAEH